ncbi:hypothetical protein [Falsiroseomonas tokyonensis]|uniref:Uncharacterized protein n=1 Tax=Falsiroseomonas tokyonensis TaxID=430521 RepID=A0ABV7BRQ8_9PROT|nr:hypothetical protein [Falsiroseomonas tokyonensis]
MTDAAPQTILHNAAITTMDPAQPAPGAVAITDGRFFRHRIGA